MYCDVGQNTLCQRHFESPYINEVLTHLCLIGTYLPGKVYVNSVLFTQMHVQSVKQNPPIEF